MTVAAKKIFLLAFIAIEVIFLALGGYILAVRSGDGGSVQAGSGNNKTGTGGDSHDGTDEAGGKGEDKPSTGEQLAALYNKVLDGIANEDFTSEDITIGSSELPSEFTYALHDFTGDGQPDLLIHKGDKEWSVVKGIVANQDYTDVIRPSRGFYDGAAGAGGLRGSVQVDSAGAGLIHNKTEFIMRPPNATFYTFDGAEFVAGQSAGGDPIQPMWTSVDDRAAVNALAGASASAGAGTGGADGGAADAGDQAQAPNPAPPAQAQAAQAGDSETAGSNHVSGTIRVMKTSELVALQGYTKSPNGETDAQSFVILVLDQPTDITGIAIGLHGTPQTRSAKLVLLPDSMANKDGQHVKAALDPALATWPSDASLPLGEPKTTQVF